MKKLSTRTSLILKENPEFLKEKLFGKEDFTEKQDKLPTLQDEFDNEYNYYLTPSPKDKQIFEKGMNSGCHSENSFQNSELKSPELPPRDSQIDMEDTELYEQNIKCLEDRMLKKEEYDRKGILTFCCP